MKKYYTIYRENTDEIIAFGSSSQCVETMKLKSIESFYSLVSRSKSGKNKRYKIIVEEYTSED